MHALNPESLSFLLSSTFHHIVFLNVIPFILVGLGLLYLLPYPSSTFLPLLLGGICGLYVETSLVPPKATVSVASWESCPVFLALICHEALRSNWELLLHFCVLRGSPLCGKGGMGLL